MNINEINETVTQPDQPAPAIELSEEQRIALTTIQDWFDDGSGMNQCEFKLGGYAGTGKTTLIKSVIKELQGQKHTYLLCAFTGKAVNVLQRKGLHQAATIHSSIYHCEINKDGTYSFSLRSHLAGDPSLIIVDEASMISQDLYNDLRSFGIPILFVGDPGQLEPVGDNPNLMAKPDYVLSKIHRQAEKSPIITIANEIRNGGIFRRIPDQDAYILRDKRSITPELILKASQLIVAKNQTRNAFNAQVRRFKGSPPMSLVPDEKLIVLKNNKNFGVFNGMILYLIKVEQDRGDAWFCNLKDDMDNIYRNIPVWKKPFIGELKKGEYATRHVVHMDFAYAITCHKSQGSEWDHVMLYDEYMPPTVWDMKRWRYTGITRASNKIEIFV